MTAVKVGSFGLIIAASLLVAVLSSFHSIPPVHAGDACALVLTHDATVLQGDHVYILAEVICVKKNGGTQTVNNQYKKVCWSSPVDPDDYGRSGGCVYTRSDIVSFQTHKLGTYEVKAEVLSRRHNGLSADSTFDAVPAI